MRYLGIDVHTQATVWCLLDAEGNEVERGKVETTAPQLSALVQRLRLQGELVVGQEVGGQSTFVHDVVTSTGVKISSFNAQHLRMIASSRKKSDRRDAYWIAKAMQTGMTPHPVYVPTGEIRLLRQLLSRRDALVAERKRWYVRAHYYLRAAGLRPKKAQSVQKLLAAAQQRPEGLDAELIDSIEMCQRMETAARRELATIHNRLKILADSWDDVRRLQTIPGVGPICALTLLATVGEVSRFADARHLASYVGVVPSVRQSGGTCTMSGITKQGSSRLRRTLYQSALVTITRANPTKARAFQNAAVQIRERRGRMKVAVVAVARRLLRVAYYILRDGTTYDSRRLRGAMEDVMAA